MGQYQTRRNGSQGKNTISRIFFIAAPICCAVDRSKSPSLAFSIQFENVSAERCRRKSSGMLKEDTNPPRHGYGAVCEATDCWACAALGDAFEQWRKTRGDKKQPWLGGKVDYTPLIHAPDNRRIADDPIKICNSTEERFVLQVNIDVYDAKLILAIHSHQIDGAKRIAGYGFINRVQAFFEDSRASVQKSQNQLSTDSGRIVQQKGRPGLSPFGWSLGSRNVGSFRFFGRSVARLRYKQMGNILQSSREPFFGSPVLFEEGGLCHFLSLQVQVIETMRSRAKISSNQPSGVIHSLGGFYH